MRLTGSLLDALHGLSTQLESAMQWAFFRAIFSFLDDEVDAFRANMLGGIWELVMGLALSLATIWVLWQGYLIMSGRSRESLMGLVVSSLRTVLILTAATTFTFGSTELYRTFTESLPRQINYVVSGSDDAPADDIDESLTTMQAVFVALDALPGVDNTNSKTDKDRAMWMTGIGVAGPAVIGGALLLLYKLALAMFVGFGPLFILALLFDQTKPMFSKWLFYGIGTLFSLAVLVFMVSVAMRMVIAVGAAYAAQVGVAMMTPGGSSTGISTLAMQQGGLGMILTVLLVMTPPMAAAFFNGVLGQFAAYSAFGTVGARGGRDSAGRTPQQPGYQFDPPQANRGQGAGGGSADTKLGNGYAGPSPGSEFATKR